MYHSSRDQLYRLPSIDEVDLIYDHLLPAGAVNTQQYPGECRDFAYRPFRYGRAPHSPLVAWFYRPPPFTAVPSDGWAEITHCGGSAFEAHASWYYVVRGSGIYVNVGSTISFRGHADAVQHFLGLTYTEDRAPISTRLPEAARAAGYDSIQFVYHCDFDCDEPANDAWPGRGDGNGCGHELMLIQTSADGSALGGGGDLPCPTNVVFRQGQDASLPCECVEQLSGSLASVIQLRSQRGNCAVCRDSSVLLGASG